MALQKQLGDPSRGPKVAIDLKGWVGVEQVGVNASSLHVVGIGVVDQGQHVAQHKIGVVAILKARPKVYLPSHRPAGAAIAAQFQ